MADTPKCPTCHSSISTDPKKQAQGSTGVDMDGKPLPRWTDDPILTSQGFSGKDYIGQFRPRKVHIKELQDDRKQIELDLEIEPTNFSDLEEHGFHFRKTHLIELRESTEKILDSVGDTLENYFKLDSYGKEIAPGPNDAVKKDWTDVSRGLEYLDKTATEKKEFLLPSGTLMLSPTLPVGTHIRAIHIEDLRHPLYAGIPVIMIAYVRPDPFYAGSPTAYTGKKIGPVSYIKAEIL